MLRRVPMRGARADGAGRSPSGDWGRWRPALTVQHAWAVTAEDRRRDVRRTADRQPAREFRDASGRQWRVFEVPEQGTAERRWPPSLVFESDAAIRRVRDFPTNWRALSDAELDALSWRT
jgi:hypothetical protein